MRAPATRKAADLWAVVMHAVRITYIYEERAQGLMCSVRQARRAHISAHHDPEQFSDRETPPVRVPFRVPAQRPILRDDAESSEDVDATVQAAVGDATRLFVLLGWPEASAQAGADHIADALQSALANPGGATASGTVDVNDERVDEPAGVRSCAPSNCTDRGR